MIKIAGSATFSLNFPAKRPLVFKYYSDMGRLASFLNYITLLSSNADNHHRLEFESTELSKYTIRVICDVALQLNEKKYQIYVEPIDNLPAIKPEATLSSTSSRGYYSSKANFFEEGDYTRVDYSLTINAKLPAPKGLRFMPGSVTSKIAQNITNRRLSEIANNFIQASLAEFPSWLETQDSIPV